MNILPHFQATAIRDRWKPLLDVPAVPAAMMSSREEGFASPPLRRPDRFTLGDNQVLP